MSNVYILVPIIFNVITVYRTIVGGGEAIGVMYLDIYGIFIYILLYIKTFYCPQKHNQK